MIVHRYIFVLVLALVATGCVMVDPRVDFDRAGELSVRAAGVGRWFDPEQMQSDAAHVERCLEDGLTVEEAAEVALINNPALQAAMYEIGVSRAELVQAGLLSNPTLGVALRLPAGGGLANVDFDLAQSIAELWQIQPRTQAAERDLEQTILRVARLAVETAAQAREGYYRVVGAERRLALAVENQEISRQILELSEVRRDAGAGSELDVNLTRGVQLEVELAVRLARLEAASARRALATILGLPTDASKLNLLNGFPELPERDLIDEELIRLAGDERLDVMVLRESAYSAEARLILEHRRTFANVSLGVAFERDSRSRSSGRDWAADSARASIAAGRLAPPEFESRSAGERDSEFIIGPSLSMELPIFDQNQAQIAKARFVLEQRLRLLEGLENSLIQEVRESADRARTAWEAARFYRDQVLVQAERNLELSRESYRAGKSSILSVLAAQQKHLASREGYSRTLEAAAAAIPNLERTIGLPFAKILERLADDEAGDVLGDDVIGTAIGEPSGT